MQLERFILDEWFDESRGYGTRWDLGESTGPHWTMAELLAVATEDERAAIEKTSLEYSAAAGDEGLRAVLAERYRADPEDVLVVTGAAEALLAIFFTAAEPGANVVVPDPVFEPIVAVPRALGLEVRSYGLRRDQGFAIDLDELADLVDGKTKVILVNSPHNPTGAVILDETMRDLRDVAAKHGASLVSDEVYHPVYHGAPGATAAGLEGASIVGDMSKAFSLSGLRLGWIVERNRRLRERYLRARMYFTVSNSPLTEGLATIALRHADIVLERAQSVASSNLRSLRSFIDGWSDHLDWVPPGGGTVCFPQLRRRRRLGRSASRYARPECSPFLATRSVGPPISGSGLVRRGTSTERSRSSAQSSRN